MYLNEYLCRNQVPAVNNNSGRSGMRCIRTIGRRLKVYMFVTIDYYRSAATVPPAGTVTVTGPVNVVVPWTKRLP